MREDDFLGCKLMADDGCSWFDFLMYFYVLNFVFMFFNFVKINKLIFKIFMLMCHW